MEKEKDFTIKAANKSQESHEEIHFDPQGILDDIDYYKFSEEVKHEISIYDSEKEALKAVKEIHAEAFGEEDPLVKKYEEMGPLKFEELKKKHKEELSAIGLNMEELTSYKVEQGDVLTKDPETEETEERREIIYIQDYKKFVNYLKQINPEKMSGPQVTFLDSTLTYLTDGIKEYYDISKSDERLEDLMLASKDIISEYKRLDRGQKIRLFPQLRDMEDYILAARGEYLREFNYLTEKLNTIPSLEKIWGSDFDKGLYLKTLDNVHKRIGKILKDQNALKNCVYMVRDYEEKFHKDLEFAQSLLVKNPVENIFMEKALSMLVGNQDEKVLKEVTLHLEDFLIKLR